MLDKNLNDFKIKIVKLPAFYEKYQIHSTELNCVLLPPLALGQITAYLRMRNLNIDQDDLNIKIHYDNRYSDSPADKIDESLFFDEERVIKYYKGYKDEYLDLNLEKVIKKSKFEEHRVILLSIHEFTRNLSNIMFALSFARFLKKKYNPIIGIGGSFGAAIDLLGSKYKGENIDFLVQGPGEVVLFELLIALKNRQRLTMTSTVSFSEDTRTLRAETKGLVKPDFTGLPLEKYKYRGMNSNYNKENLKIIEEFSQSETLILPFKFLRGCPFECIFCYESSSKLSCVMPPPKVVPYLRELKQRYNPTGFFFLSDTINISKRYIDALCNEIISNKLEVLWSDCARVDYLDRDLIFKLRRAGCIRLIYGIETASPRMLEYINKNVDLERLEKVLKWTDEAGIWTGLEIICGLPHEREEDINSTILFLNKNRKYINRIYYNVFDLKNRSKLFQDPVRYNIKNITGLYQYPKDDESMFNRDYIHFGFDEIGGLNWKDKEKQMLYSYNKVVKEIGEEPFPYLEEEHFLFFLYSKYQDKNKISSIFNQVGIQKRNYCEQEKIKPKKEYYNGKQLIVNLK